MWSARRRFAINTTLFDRLPHHPQVNDVVGVFTTTFLLEVEHDSGTFEAFARRLQSRLWSDIEHRHFNGVKFIRELRKRGVVDGAGYPVVFTSTLGGGDDAVPTFPWHGESTHAISQTSGVLIDCQVAEAAGVLSLNWDVVNEAFEPGSVAQMFGVFTRLLEMLRDTTEAWSLSCR
jgi:non-ribosomal peptide synthetase component F